MIYLDSDTDSILPYGLKGTPFETVFMALQAVASTVWPVDAAELRAAIGWGWYLDNNLEELILLSAGKQYIQNTLISEQVPLIKSTQTQEELVDLLYRWKNYKPTFDKLEELYIPYAARVDIRPITDEATQEILPVTDIHNAFYVVLTDIDWSRPLTLGEATLIAERATPMGSRPIAVFQFEETTTVYPQLAYGDVNLYTGTFEPAADPIPPEPEAHPYYIIINETTGEIVYSISETEESPSMVFSQVGHIEMPDSEMITVYETCVTTQAFYFTSSGRGASSDTSLEAGTNYPLFDETGTDAGESNYPGYLGSNALAFVKVDGNTYGASAGDALNLGLHDRLRLNNTDAREAWSVLVEKVSPSPAELTVYFTNQGSAGTGNTSMSSSQSYQLYDASGNALSFDLTKKYTINKYYNISGTEKSVGSYAKCIDVMGNLYLRPNASPTIFRAELSLSPQTTIEAYFTANGSSETTDTYCGSTDTKTLYDASGISIPYDSTKTYTTVASYVVNGDTAYTDFDGNFAAWSDTVLKGRGTNNYYFVIVIRVE